MRLSHRLLIELRNNAQQIIDGRWFLQERDRLQSQTKLFVFFSIGGKHADPALRRCKLDPLQDIEPVHRGFKIDIQEHQVRLVLFNVVDRLLGSIGRRHIRKAAVFEQPD